MALNYDELYKINDSSEPEKGSFIFPKTSSVVNDGKDHFPINTEGRGRSAISRVNQYDTLPTWYTGDMNLQEFVTYVVNKVKEKYPEIKVSTKAYIPKPKQNKEKLSDAKTSKKWYIGHRSNPQLKSGGYYKKYGQLTDKEAKAKENVAYGDMTLIPYFTEEGYKKAISDLEADGKRVVDDVMGYYAFVEVDGRLSKVYLDRKKRGVNYLTIDEEGDFIPFKDIISSVSVFENNMDGGYEKVIGYHKNPGGGFVLETKHVNKIKDSGENSPYKGRFSTSEEAKKFLSDMVVAQKVDLMNDFFENNDWSERIRVNDEEEINSLFDSPWDALQAADLGEYRPTHTMVAVLEDMSLYSFNTLDELNNIKIVDDSELIDYLVKE